MIPNVTFLPGVAGELETARRWYEERRLGLGNEFMDGFQEAVNVLVHRAQAFGNVYRDVRRLPFKRFPYGIFYRVRDHEIVVIAVLHGRQSMRRLQNRD